MKENSKIVKFAAHTKDGLVLLPDVRIRELGTYTTKPLCGYGFIIAVYDGPKCVGWYSP
jgi:hypothetical protein